MADETDDLYGDIDDTPVFAMSSAVTHHTQAAARPTTTTPTATKSATAPNHPRSLVEEVQFLQDKVAKLERENQVLKRNMGILFRTATAEIQRKDKEILRLHAQPP